MYFIGTGENLYNSISYKMYLQRVYTIRLRWLFYKRVIDLIT